MAAAHDPNPGDTLTYAWSATAGSFSDSAAASTSWTAPLSTGIQTLTFTVTDSRGLSSSIVLAVNVLQGGGEGDAQLSISFNSSPVVASLSATPTQLSVGQTAAVSVAASDVDGDSLSYSWRATCAGSWTGASSSSAQFTPSLLPAGACNNCRLTVSVSDGRGGVTTGTVALCVRDTPPANHLPPVIIRSYRSSDTATAGQVITYEVVASDPQGSALTFSWEANTGTLGTPDNSASRSRITWTAPSCVRAGVTPSITATVTNAFHLTATRSFTVTGLPACPSVEHWALTGSMAEERAAHEAVLLPNGQVLVMGGVTLGDMFHNSAELYDPASGSWSDTGSMRDVRAGHTATLLPNGQVLVTGGANNMVPVLETAELYDPATGTWSPAGSMASARHSHTATLLPNGQVLVTGGFGELGVLATAELYDPATNTWSSSGSLSDDRRGHTATLLPNGQVLVAGGVASDFSRLATAELYDPATGTWHSTGSMASARLGHTATLLLNGKVLVAGGDSFASVHGTSELYDPVSGTFSDAGLMVEVRSSYTATLLPNGQVLAAGGGSPTLDESLTSAELYTP
jgi:hypothetical protein